MPSASRTIWTPLILSHLFNLRVKLQDLSCGGCPYCTRAHSNWSGFDQDEDDMVPLANKPWGQPVREGHDQEEEEMGSTVDFHIELTKFF
jgi:hypothetical protein